ncbi:MAG: RHS repeat-associated core domain-containing protein [Crenarchaeota archaeon]|nr:RHS repeat-associated core domain-containing protein [Thermoproteota archaeon]
MTLAYDGAGSRITKKRERKVSGGEWTTELATHYTGIGSEIREDAINNATKVVVNLPQGLGRYDIASASESSANTVPSFEWYLKNHLGSTMLVYGTNGNDGSLKAAYDYRAFGEQVDLTWPTDKVTETFTGKELDEETDLSNHGARMLDPMLGLWIAVDPERFFSSPYLYMSNGYNPIKAIDPNGKNPVALFFGGIIFISTAVYVLETVETGMDAKDEFATGMSQEGEGRAKSMEIFVQKSGEVLPELAGAVQTMGFNHVSPKQASKYSALTDLEKQKENFSKVLDKVGDFADMLIEKVVNQFDNNKNDTGTQNNEN